MVTVQSHLDGVEISVTNRQDIIFPRRIFAPLAGPKVTHMSGSGGAMKGITVSDELQTVRFECLFLNACFVFTTPPRGDNQHHHDTSRPHNPGSTMVQVWNNLVSDTNETAWFVCEYDASGALGPGRSPQKLALTVTVPQLC